MHWIRRLILNLLLNSLAILVVDQVLPRVIVDGGVVTYVITGVVLGLVNGIVKPLLKLAAFPLMMLTAGLFILVINGIILYIVTLIIPLLGLPGTAFRIEGAHTFLIAAVLFSMINFVEHWMVHDRE